MKYHIQGTKKYEITSIDDFEDGEQGFFLTVNSVTTPKSRFFLQFKNLESTVLFTHSHAHGVRLSQVSLLTVFYVGKV